jgi:hypothetical protein
LGISLAILAGIFIAHRGDFSQNTTNITTGQTQQSQSDQSTDQALALDVLANLPVKERASKAGYTREQFGGNWASWGKCDVRQQILNRDLVEIKLDNDGCTVLSGVLHDPYTDKIIDFKRGSGTSSAIQIDHVVAISNAWQTGAQDLSQQVRKQLYQDPLELIAVDGPTNAKKSDGDAATWLPPNKSFHCQYVARQIAVKIKYSLWVTSAEHDAMAGVLKSCPDERLPAP